MKCRFLMGSLSLGSHRLFPGVYLNVPIALQSYVKLEIMETNTRGLCFQAAASDGSLQLHFHQSVNMAFWSLIPKYLFPTTAATICPLPAWHTSGFSSLQVPH